MSGFPRRIARCGAAASMSTAAKRRFSARATTDARNVSPTPPPTEIRSARSPLLGAFTKQLALEALDVQAVQKPPARVTDERLRQTRAGCDARINRQHRRQQSSPHEVERVRARGEPSAQRRPLANEARGHRRLFDGA